MVAVEAGLAALGADREGEERGEGADDRRAEGGVVAALQEVGEHGAVQLRCCEAAGVVLEGGEDAGERALVAGELGEQAGGVVLVGGATDAEAGEEVGPGGDVEGLVAAAQASEALVVGVRRLLGGGGAGEHPGVAVFGGAEELRVDAGPGVAGEAAGERAGGDEAAGVGEGGEGEGLAGGVDGGEGGLDQGVVVVVGAQAGAGAFDGGVVAGEAEVVGGGVGEEGGEEEGEVGGVGGEGGWWRGSGAAGVVVGSGVEARRGSSARSQSFWTGSKGPGARDMSPGTGSAVVRRR